MTPSISSFTAPVAPQAATPPLAQPQPKAFAQMLSHRQAMTQEASEPAVAAAPADEAATPQPAAKRPAGAPQAAERSSHKADKADKTDKTKTPRAAGPATEQTKASSDKTDAAGNEPVDSVLAEWLAALNLPATPAQPPQAAVAQGAVHGQADLHDTGKPGTAAQQGLQTTKGVARGLIEANAGQGLRNDPAQEGSDRLQAARDKHEQPAALAADPQASVSAWQAAAERTNTSAEAAQRLDT
ncbi:MAG: hypothetical protein H7Y33_11775, partial [Cytophagales bacterium]|nr:hypothetical protein [Rhizobacter sp.]